MKTVIWDWNGTLLDDVDVCVAAINRLLDRRGLPRMHRQRYRSVFTFPVQIYYEEMGFDFGSEDFAEVAVEYHESYEAVVREAELHRDAVDALERMQAAGVRQAVLSALEEGRLVRELRLRGIDGYFENIFGLSDLQAVGKVERGLELLTALGHPRPCWIVGDTDHDNDVARELGILPILVECGHHSFDRLRKTGAPVVSSVTEAADYILNDGRPS